MGSLSTRRHLGRKASSRLKALLGQSRPGASYTFEHILSEVRPPSPEALAVALNALTKDGQFRRVLRVESPRTSTGLKDFDSLIDIPSKVYDYTTDQEFDVTPNDIRVIYIAQ